MDGVDWSSELYSYAPLGAAGHKSVSRVCISAQDKSHIFDSSVKEADRMRNLRVSRQVSMMTVSGINKELLDIVKGQKLKIKVPLNILGRSWQMVSKYSLGPPEP